MTSRIRSAALVCVALGIFLAAPAGAFCFATIRVHVFVDLNGNGVQDAGEPGQPGIPVHFDQADVNGTVHELVVTDGNGNADLPTVVAVPYNVSVVTASGAMLIGTLAPGTGYQCNTTTTLLFALPPAAVPALSQGAIGVLLLVMFAAGVFAIRA